VIKSVNVLEINEVEGEHFPTDGDDNDNDSLREFNVSDGTNQEEEKKSDQNP